MEATLSAVLAPLPPEGVPAHGRPSRYLIHAPIVVVVYEEIVAGGQGVPAFLVTLALALPLTIPFARAFASVFELPFQRHHSWSGLARRPHPRAEGAPV